MNDPVKFKEWRKRVLGPERRELSSTEAAHMLTILKLTGEPYGQSNNQLTHTDSYTYNGKRYDVTYGLSDEPVVEEFIEDE